LNRWQAEGAIRALGRSDPKLGAFIRRHGPCLLQPTGVASPFQALAESIVYQQLSGKAAATIYGRFAALYPRRRPTARRTLDLDEATLRTAGLSRNKALSILDLAGRVLDRTVPGAARLQAMPDDEIIDRLTAVRGIGPWTVQMLLIFNLGRPDILPATDYGIQKGLQRLHRLRQLPKPRDIETLGACWAPWRSIASWYLWRAAETAGRSA